MANYNKVILMGNLTRDPEIRQLESGTSVANFSVAVNERWTNRETGEAQEKTCFIDCDAWGRQAEILEQYLSKGDPIHLEGSLEFDTWEQDGVRRSKHKVKVFRFQMLGRSSSNNGNSTESRGQTPPQDPTPARTPTPKDLEDEIPF